MVTPFKGKLKTLPNAHRHHPTIEDPRAAKRRGRKATIGSTLSSKPPGAATHFDWLRT